MLLIDIGNSRIKSGLWSNDAWVSVRSAAYRVDYLNNQFDNFFKDIKPCPVYVACVAESISGPLVQWLLKHWAIQPVFASATSRLSGVVNAYTKPDTLGVDRWLAMVAAYNEVKVPVCVIDCGTAVTVDVIDVHGLHHGGLIMPGLKLMRDALISNASKIHSTKGNFVELAVNTDDAVESGCLQLLASGLDQICLREQKKYSEMKIFITGGDGGVIAKQMNVQTHYKEMLVLDGLRIFATEGR